MLATVLIGSLGVGNSVLFFVAAMYRCSQKAEEEVFVDRKKGCLYKYLLSLGWY
jgi:hypothetical protein